MKNKLFLSYFLLFAVIIPLFGQDRSIRLDYKETACRP